MTILSRMRQTATVYLLSEGDPNRYGDAEPDFDGGPDYPCILQQAATSEVLVGRDTRHSQWLLILPPEADIDSLSEVESGDLRFRVIGDPNEVGIHDGRVHHIEARLEVFEG